MKYDWKTLLNSIEQTVLNDKDYDYIFRLFLEKPATILNQPGTLQDIQLLESRLEMTLPPSYKEFLSVSNGLKILSTTYWNIFPAEQVNFLRDFDPHLVSVWDKDIFNVDDEEYFIYGEEQNSTCLRGYYMKSCLAVSGWGDAAIILLNPEVKFNEEWEAWAFANWYPGAYRFKSFWDLVNSEFQTSIQVKNLD
jgi:hypothetical protein